MEPTTASRTSRSDGEPGTEVRVVAVDANGRSVEVDGLDGLEQALGRPGLRVWVDITGSDAAILDRTSAILRIHPLVIEDIAERNQRAKAERLDDGLHIVLFALGYEGEVVESEVDFVLAERYLLTAHGPDWDPRRAPQLRSGAASLLAAGPDYLLHAFTDWIVDGYFPVLDRLTDEIDELQDQVIEDRSSWTLERLFVLKRELIRLRRAITPAREIFNQLTNRELGMIQPQHVIYFRDVYDHLIRATDEIDTYRELVAGTLDIYLTSVNNDLSNIMKRLTGVTVILAGMGAVAGLFGMSEAGLAMSGREAAGFWFVVAATVAGAAAVAIVLRRIDWI